MLIGWAVLSLLLRIGLVTMPPSDTLQIIPSDPESVVASILANDGRLVAPVAFDIARTPDGTEPRTRARARAIARFLDSADVVRIGDIRRCEPGAAARRCTYGKYRTIVRIGRPMDGPDGTTRVVVEVRTVTEGGTSTVRGETEYLLARQPGWKIVSKRGLSVSALEPDSASYVFNGFFFAAGNSTLLRISR